MLLIIKFVAISEALKNPFPVIAIYNNKVNVRGGFTPKKKVSFSIFFTIMYAFRFTDFMVNSMPFKQKREVWNIILLMKFSGMMSATLSLLRMASSMNRVDSIKDTIKEPIAIEPRLYRVSSFIDEKTGRNGIVV